jgi:hypothetical protein
MRQVRERLFRRQTAPVKLVGGKRPTAVAGLSPASSLTTGLPVRLSRMANMMQLIRQIRDYNADASKAVSNTLRLANGRWSFKVYKTGTDNPDRRGQRLVDEFVRDQAVNPTIGMEYGGGFDVLIDMIHLTAATQGAAAGEIELVESLDGIADIIIVNPWLIDFERDEGSLRWVPGIQGFGSFTALHPLQFKYIPVDPEPGVPRGRSPFWSALDLVFFQMEVLRDLKAAVHFSGYPRIDISVAWESVLAVIKETRPDLLEPTKGEELREYLDLYLGDIESLINSLEPDDAFIHFDSVTGDYIVPSGKSVSTGELTAAIDTQIISGLKQLPVLLGRNEGATTTHATVQWQVYVRELESFQRVSSRLMSWVMTFFLRVNGFQSQAVLEYEPLRTVDRQAEATAMKTETEAALLQVAAGWIDHDEAAERVVGHPATGEPAPAPEPPTGPGESDADGEESEVDEDESEMSEDEERASVRTWFRQLGDEMSRLPMWQIGLYRDAEESNWDTYLDQLGGASSRMDHTMETVPESELEEPAAIIGDNGHGD